MVKRIAAKIPAEVPISPCFNCGQVQKLSYDPAKDNVEPGALAGLRCEKCRVTGPGAHSILEAIGEWNRLYATMQAARAYIAISGVSSPMEFAGWVEAIRNDAKEIAKTKTAIKSHERLTASWTISNDAAIRAADAFRGITLPSSDGFVTGGFDAPSYEDFSEEFVKSIKLK
jgi:hypothetical protein